MYVLLPLSGAALGLVFFLLLRAGLYQPTGGTAFLIVGIAALVGMFNTQAAEKLKDIADAVLKAAPKGKNDSPTTTPAAGAKPSITQVNPASGPVGGGTLVTIKGSGFAAGATVRFGDTPGTQVALADTNTLTVIAPPAATAARVDVRVAVPNSQEIVQSGAFTYKQPVGKVTAVDPSNGPAGGGTPVTVRGEHFAAPAVVSFGDVPAKDATLVDDKTITVKTPPHAAGSVDVRVDAGDDLVGVQTAAYVYKP